MRKKKITFSYATPKEIESGLKRIWGLETVSPSSTRVIEDVGRALEAFEIVYRTYGADFEGLADSN